MINNYDDIAESYTLLLENKNNSCDLSYIQDTNLKNVITSLSNDASILDIACGEGNDLTEIYHYSVKNNKNFKLYGSDMSKGMIAQAKNRQILSELDIRELDYSDSLSFKKMTDWHKKFDLIFCSYAIYTYPSTLFCSEIFTFNQYLANVFQNIKMFLKDDGIFVCNFRDFSNIRKKIRLKHFLTFGKNFLFDKKIKYRDKITIYTNDNVKYEWSISKVKNLKMDINCNVHYALVTFLINNQQSSLKIKYREVTNNDIQHICKLSSFLTINENPIFFENNDFYSITFKLIN